MRKTILTVPAAADRRKSSWRKHLTGVDVTKTNGFAFEGAWLRGGERAELPVGALILGYDEPGSMKNWHPLIRVWRVEEGAALAEVYRYEGATGERSWALAVRDGVAALFEAPAAGAPAESSPLAQFSVEELIAELRRRGAWQGC